MVFKDVTECTNTYRSKWQHNWNGLLLSLKIFYGFFGNFLEEIMIVNLTTCLENVRKSRELYPDKHENAHTVSPYCMTWLVLVSLFVILYCLCRVSTFKFSYNQKKFVVLHMYNVQNKKYWVNKSTVN